MPFVPDRPGHDRRYSVDCSKLQALGWEPTHTFEPALDATVDWYVAQRGLVAADQDRRVPGILPSELWQPRDASAVTAGRRLTG